MIAIVYQLARDLNTKLFYDFIKSEANVADIGTRPERFPEFFRAFKARIGKIPSNNTNSHFS